MREREILEHPLDPTLLRKCCVCYPEETEEQRAQIPPLPPGKRGYSDGYCDKHHLEAREELTKLIEAKRQLTPP